MIKHFLCLITGLIILLCSLTCQTQMPNNSNWSGHNGRIRKILLTSDDQLVITGGEEGCIKIWDRISGKMLRTLLGHCYFMALTSDDRYLISGGWKVPELRVFDLSTGLVNQIININEETETIALIPNSQEMLTAGKDSSIIQWDIISGQQIDSSRVSTAVKHLSVSQDGRYAVAAGDSIVLVWDIQHKQILSKMVLPYAGIALFAPNPKQIIWCGDARIDIRDWNGNIIKTIEKRETFLTLWSAKLSSDSKYIVGTVGDHYPSLWDISAEKLVRRHAYGYWVWDVAFTSDRKEYMAAGQGPVIFWDFATGNTIRTFPGASRFVEYMIQSPDRKRLLLSRNALEDSYQMHESLEVFDLETFQSDSITHFEGWGNKGDISPKGTIAFTGKHNRQYLWDVNKKRVIKSFPETGKKYYGMVLSPDERYVMQENSDEAIVWSIPGDSVVKVLPKSGRRYYHTGRFSPKGNYLAINGIEYNSLSLLDIKSFQSIRGMKFENELSVIAFSPDEKKVLGGCNTGEIYVWDTKTGEVLYKMKDHKKMVTMISCSSNGKYLLSSSKDMTAKVWDMSTGQLLETISTPQFGDPNYKIHPKYRVWKWMEWAFFMP